MIELKYLSKEKLKCPVCNKNLLRHDNNIDVKYSMTLHCSNFSCKTTISLNKKKRQLKFFEKSNWIVAFRR